MVVVEKKRAAMASMALLFFAGVLLGLASAEVHKVGDSQGWTILGSPNYTAWAASKTFKVGDTIVFEYNKQFHDVMKVRKSDYRACNAASPMLTYATGNDSIAITSGGHHFFLCGFPGHCDAGQKVDIRVAKPASSAPSGGPSAPPGTGGTATPAPPTPAPGANTASGVRKSVDLMMAVAAVSSLMIMS